MGDQPTDVKQSVREWWAANPMTYADDHGATDYTAPDGSRYSAEMGTREFFQHADEILYAWNAPLHNASGRFGKIFPYASYRGTPVLEVGCGMGCMAMNWAMHGAQVTAVDLNPVAVRQTRRRLEVFGLSGGVHEADGEHLPFADGSFDYVYSWGVLHHTPNTRSAIGEVLRVLKPGGRVGIMLYHRASLLYRYTIEYVEGYLHMEDAFLSPLQLGSRYGDGARGEGNPHTWPITPEEARRDLFSRFRQVQIEIFGTDVDPILDMWFPKLSHIMPRPLRKALARRWGWSLWITGEK